MVREPVRLKLALHGPDRRFFIHLDLATGRSKEQTMKRKQFTEEQIMDLLKEADAGAVVTELCRKHGMSSATSYAWKAKFGGLKVADARRLRALEEENARLKRLLADTMGERSGLCRTGPRLRCRDPERDRRL